MAGRGKGERNAIQREQDGENLLGQGSDVPKLPARSVGPASAIQGAPRFLSSFSLSFPRESNVGIIQVDKQALTCTSYEVVSSWNKWLRIEIPSLEFARDTITTLIVPRTLSFSRDIRLARSRKVNGHPVHRFLHCDDTKSALKCTYRTHKIVLRGEKTSSSTHARVRTRGSTCTARR